MASECCDNDLDISDMKHAKYSTDVRSNLQHQINIFLVDFERLQKFCIAIIKIKLFGALYLYVSMHYYILEYVIIQSHIQLRHEISNTIFEENISNFQH